MNKLNEEEIIRDLEDFLWQNSIVEGFIDETAEQRQFDMVSFSKKDYLAIQRYFRPIPKRKRKECRVKSFN